MEEFESVMTELDTNFDIDLLEARHDRDSLAVQYFEEMKWYKERQEVEAAELKKDAAAEPIEEPIEEPVWEEPIEEPKDAAAEPIKEPVKEERMSEAETKDAAMGERWKAYYEAAAAAEPPHKRPKRERTERGAQAAAMGWCAWTLGKADAPGRRRDLDPETVDALRAEQGLSEHYKVPWKERGPLPPKDDKPYEKTV